MVLGKLSTGNSSLALSDGTLVGGDVVGATDEVALETIALSTTASTAAASCGRYGLKVVGCGAVVIVGGPVVGFETSTDETFALGTSASVVSLGR